MNSQSQELPPPPPPSQTQEQPQSRSRGVENQAGFVPPHMRGLNGATRESYNLNGAIANLSISNNNNFAQQQQSQQNPNSMAAAAAAANGMMGNRAQWPSTGDQMDMQVLWELINNIAEVQQGIREQTNGVLQRVQLIQSRDDVSEAIISNGLSSPPPISSEPAAPTTLPKEQAYLNEISSLRSQLSSKTTELSNLQTQHHSLATLCQHHESALSTLLSKLRPYATHHTQALEAQKAHYLSLLEQERGQNLDLRLEVSRLQDGLGKVLSLVRAAEQEEGGQNRRWIKQLAGAKAENRVLRGVCGLQVEPESSESESEDEEEWGTGVMEMELTKNMGVLGGVGMKRS